MTVATEDIRDRLAQLPRRAVVAFAARCARRVQPLTHALPQQGRDAIDRDAIDRAIAIAEAFAKGTDVASAAADAAARAATAANKDDAAGAATWAAAAAVAAAAVAVANAAWAADAAARAAARAATDTEAAWAAAWAAADDDLDRLIALNLGQPGTLGAPIDPSKSGPLGPLWPQGVPEWYTEAGVVQHVAATDTIRFQESVQVEKVDPNPNRLVLEAFVDEFADTEEVSAALADLCYALNAYHIAAGGNGLVIDDWEVYVPEPEPAEAM